MTTFDSTTSISTRRALKNVPPPLPLSEGSPFYAERRANIIPTENGMGYVVTAGEQKFRVRVACEHWAPNHSINDCRRGCEAKGK